jgi:hypothetical protein
MHDLEIAIIDWFVARLKPVDEAVRPQLAAARIVEREFTAGAGAYLALESVAGEVQRQSSEVSYIDGPELRSPEMTEGALVTLHFLGGVANSFEIWSYAGDYPTDRHPREFVLVEPKMNHVDLRGEL